MRAKGNGHVSFAERNEMRKKWVNQIREREERKFGPKEIVHARSRGCAVRDIIRA